MGERFKLTYTTNAEFRNAVNNLRLSDPIPQETEDAIDAILFWRRYEKKKPMRLNDAHEHLNILFGSPEMARRNIDALKQTLLPNRR